jgi:Uma2 family endonuclease
MVRCLEEDVAMAEAVHRSVTQYTYNDYRNWPEGERWELIGGEAYAMSPAPSTRHQEISANLLVALATHLRGKACKVFAAPVDVVLSDQDVVQPDLVLICDPNQIFLSHIAGPPSLLVEIISPSTEEQDRVRKQRLYARFGIKEYWPVTSFPSMVEILALDESRDTFRISGSFGRGEVATSELFPDFHIAMDEIFSFPLTEDERRSLERPTPSTATGNGELR